MTFHVTFSAFISVAIWILLWKLAGWLPWLKIAREIQSQLEGGTKENGQAGKAPMDVGRRQR